MQKKVDAFQLRGLRKILNLNTTFVNRANTNASAINKANQEINANRPNWAQRRHVLLFSEVLMDERARLAEHVITRERNDPLRQVSYVPASATPYR